VTSLFRQFLDQALNRGDLAIVDTLVSADARAYIPGWGMPPNRLGLKQMIVSLRTAFPDLHSTVDDEIDGESKSAAIWTMRGSHQGSYLGSSPTGRLVSVEGFSFMRTAGSQIVEGWFLIDQIGLLQQLGLIPPPGGKL
jgi:predicted ester cyclase